MIRGVGKTWETSLYSLLLGRVNACGGSCESGGGLAVKDVFLQSGHSVSSDRTMDSEQLLRELEFAARWWPTVLLVNRWSTWRRGKSERTWPRCWGAMLVSRMGLAALSRTDVREESRRDFYMYLDEFQSFTTLSLANMLSELRKYRVGLILAHQYLSQLDLQVRDAILGNVGTMIAFRLGLADAEILESEFRPEVSAVDLISLANYQIYVKLMIEGVASRPFSAESLKPGLPFI